MTEGRCSAGYPSPVSLARALLNGSQQFVVRIRELPHTVFFQVVGDLLQRDAQRSQFLHLLLGLDNVYVYRACRIAMGAESVERVWRHGVDRVGTDQGFHVEQFRVARILGAGAGPQRALHLCAGVGQRLPARTGEGALELSVGELGVGDCDLALQGGSPAGERDRSGRRCGPAPDPRWCPRG